MLQRFLKSILLAGLIVLTALTGLRAQEFDYQKYPTLSFDITSLNLDLDINPEEKTLVGSARYEITSRISGLDSLILHAAHMEIDQASVNGEPVEFRLQNDSLFVQVADSSAKDEEFEVVIDYSSSPKFGVLKNENGTIWTSLLPKSTRHWLPTIDHPRVTFASTMNLTVPSGYRVMANGSQTGEEINDVNSVTYTFETENKVPVSALSFVAGRLISKQTSFGIKSINLSTEQDLMADNEQQELLQKTYQIVKETEQYLGFEFPFEQLNVTVLKDHNWEPTSWGAGTVLLYKNRGSLEAQLRQGIYAQWFGVHQRPERWSEGRGHSLIQAGLHFQLTDNPMLLNETDIPQQSFQTVYDNQGIMEWNMWQQNFQNSLGKNFQEVVTSSIRDIVKWDEGVYSSNDYATYWYEQTGQPNFEIPYIENIETVGSESDSIQYKVDYGFREQEGRLKLTFNAEKGMVDELVSLPLITVSANSRDTSEVTFTGQEDSVVVNVPMLVETVHIDASQIQNLSLDEYKPASFLIYEVRNAETADQRAKAASKLGIHADNPDLQLAIRDLLNQEQEPAVKAALLSSFAQITNGASGTEQVFLDAVSSNDEQVRLAALIALQNYPENESAVSSIKSFATSAESLNDFRNAAKIYSSVADTSAFEGFVNTMVQQDTSGFKAIYAIQELANLGGTEQAVTLAQYYTSDVYDYSIRASALAILIQHDKATEDWRRRAEELLNDADPRIRYLTVLGLPKITGLNPADALEGYLQDEYDARVYAAMEKVLK